MSFKLRYILHTLISSPGLPLNGPPSTPPIHALMAMLRTRRTRWPLNGPEVGTTVDCSDGHWKIP
jgi:hypothetical protein